MPLSRHGLREMLLLTLLLGILAWGLAYVHPALVTPVVLIWAGGLAFFRDPNRAIPAEPGLLVAPADGRVTEITRLNHHDLIDGPATRIGIFLSVFDVHINRSPCAGRAVSVNYQPGEFLDARHTESGQRNESTTLIIRPDEGPPRPIVVRLVAGLIARRIVCTVTAGSDLARGQRIGLIKFGSRTELIVARDAGWQVTAKIGDKVKGGSSVLCRHRTKTSDREDPHDQNPDRLTAQAASR